MRFSSFFSSNSIFKSRGGLCFPVKFLIFLTVIAVSFSNRKHKNGPINVFSSPSTSPFLSRSVSWGKENNTTVVEREVSRSVELWRFMTYLSLLDSSGSD